MKSTNDLSRRTIPREEDLINENKPASGNFSKKGIQLVVQNAIGRYYFTVPISEGMEKSELARIIGAEQIIDYDIQTGHVKEFGNFSENPDILIIENEYLVKTNDTSKTVELINSYKHGN